MMSENITFPRCVAVFKGLKTAFIDKWTSQGVEVLQDHDQYSTDLMKCIEELSEKERAEGSQVRLLLWSDYLAAILTLFL